jgi:hypothetical protein
VVVLPMAMTMLRMVMGAVRSVSGMAVTMTQRQMDEDVCWRLEHFVDVESIV